jgi:hypothetical protein
MTEISNTDGYSLTVPQIFAHEEEGLSMTKRKFLMLMMYCKVEDANISDYREMFALMKQEDKLIFVSKKKHPMSMLGA